MSFEIKELVKKSYGVYSRNRLVADFPNKESAKTFIHRSSVQTPIKSLKNLKVQSFYFDGVHYQPPENREYIFWREYYTIVSHALARKHENFFKVAATAKSGRPLFARRPTGMMSPESMDGLPYYAEMNFSPAMLKFYADRLCNLFFESPPTIITASQRAIQRAK